MAQHKDVRGTDARAQAGSAFVVCPECNNKIFRSGSHREQAVSYQCRCGFQGP